MRQLSLYTNGRIKWTHLWSEGKNTVSWLKRNKKKSGKISHNICREFTHAEKSPSMLRRKKQLIRTIPRITDKDWPLFWDTTHQIIREKYNVFATRMSQWSTIPLQTTQKCLLSILHNTCRASRHLVAIQLKDLTSFQPVDCYLYGFPFLCTSNQFVSFSSNSGKF